MKVDAELEQSPLNLVVGLADQLVVVQAAGVCGWWRERIRVGSLGAGKERRARGQLTWIEEEEEFETNVIDGVELELGQFHGELVELVRRRADAEQRQSEQIEALAVGQPRVVGQVVVHPLVDVVQEQHVRPGMLEQVHLVVHLLIGFGRRVGQFELGVGECRGRQRRSARQAGRGVASGAGGSPRVERRKPGGARARAALAAPERRV